MQATTSTTTHGASWNTNVHLITCVHGMWGSPDHLGHLSKILVETLEQRREVARDKRSAGAVGDATRGADGDEADGDEVNVLVAESNRSSNTYDGVDWGAERVVEEIKERIKSLEDTLGRKVTKLSIIGYSLGGLLARYVVGILHSQGFFSSVKPMNFCTIATPHIGLLRYPTFFSRLFATLGPTFLSRTGEHFYAVDKWSQDGKCLLEVMSEPDGVFYRGLTQFSRLSIYGNAVRDITVPYLTALIESYDPFVEHKESGIQIEIDPAYSPLIKDYARPTQRVSKAKPRVFSRAWLKSTIGPAFLLPPSLHAKPSYIKAVIYALLPIVYPPMIVIALAGFTYQMLSSRKRIRLLDQAGKGNRNTIMEFVRDVEREVEGAMVDLIEDGAEEVPRNSMTNNPPMISQPSVTAGAEREPELQQQDGDPNVLEGGQPHLLPAQHRMIANLNSIPHLKKRIAFLDGFSNSHGVIVSRDIKRFEFHKRGEGVLRHLADEFLL